MATLLSVHKLKMSFAARPLFDGVSFAIESGDRIGLIGPNGAGKSTLMKILAGKMKSDEGTISQQKGLRVSLLDQVPHFKPGATVESTVMEGAKDAYDWEEMVRAQRIMSQLSLSDPAAVIEDLSGGWKKRVALARELMREPDLLLLDEPTNHLDVESIMELEEIIASAPFAVMTITHDRLFLQRISTRILELDRRNPGGILSVNGDYATYLETKESMMAAQESTELKLRNTLRRETEWLRRGAKARTTKQQARITRAGELKETVADLNVRNQIQIARLDFQNTERNPKKLIEATGISKSYDGKTIVPKLDLLITPKSRIGLLGRNGCGKSTLIRLLLGSEKSDTGSVWTSEHVKVSYFEQNRESLNPETTLVKSICPSGEHVTFRGNRIHIKGYLDRFLFTQEQMEMPIGKLSGGEQSRVLIARLMLTEANVLVLDEPTNDLDVATLDVLENVLSEFNGAVILVTHDRYFLDNVTSQILAFGLDEKGNKAIVPMVGLPQWEEWHAEQAELESKIKSGKLQKSDSKQAPKAETTKKKKLSFNEQRELDSMESNIHKAEARLAELTDESLKPSIASNASKLAELTKEMGALQSEIARLYARWSELE